MVISSRANHGMQLVSGAGFELDFEAEIFLGFHPGLIEELGFVVFLSIAS